jgi:hypothetical protein
VDSIERLAAALREALTEIVLIVNQSAPTRTDETAFVRTDELEQISTPERLLYPYEEARERLGGIGRSTLYKLVERGDLVNVKIGRHSFITGDSISTFVAHLAGG